jgi:hypothetical protein
MSSKSTSQADSTDPRSGMGGATTNDQPPADATVMTNASTATRAASSFKRKRRWEKVLPVLFWASVLAGYAAYKWNTEPNAAPGVSLTLAQEVAKLERVVGASITLDDQRLIITHKPETLFSEGWLIRSTDHMLSQVGLWAAKDPSARIPAKAISVLVRSGVVDRYGNKSEIVVLALNIEPSEFRKIQWDGIHPGRVLNLFDIATLSPVYHDTLRAYCSDEGQRKASAHFCNRALAIMARN